MQSLNMRKLGIVLTTVIVGVAASGCGSDSGSQTGSSDSDSTSKSAANYEALARDAMKPNSEWLGPKDGPKATANKRVMFLSCSFAADGCNRPAEAAKEAGKALGWDVDVVDGKFDPRVYNRAIQQAVDQKVDGIIIDAISVEAVSESIARARAAGIKVGSFDGANEVADDGVMFDVQSPYRDQGKSLAAYAIWKANGKGVGYFLDAKEFKVCVEQVAGAKEAFEDCEDCEIVRVDDTVAAEAATRVPQLVSSALKQNPNINTVIAPYDAILLNAVPVLPPPSEVTVGAYNGIKAWLSLIREGKVAATSAEAKEWGTFGAFDNLNRIFAGQETVEQRLPIRLITKENIDEVPEGEAWTGDIDYASYYQQIWSTGSAE